MQFVRSFPRVFGSFQQVSNRLLVHDNLAIDPLIGPQAPGHAFDVCGHLRESCPAFRQGLLNLVHVASSFLLLKASEFNLTEGVCLKSPTWLFYPTGAAGTTARQVPGCPVEGPG
jgi:hypothetical protein